MHTCTGLTRFTVRGKTGTDSINFTASRTTIRAFLYEIGGWSVNKCQALTDGGAHTTTVAGINVTVAPA